MKYGLRTIPFSLSNSLRMSMWNCVNFIYDLSIVSMNVLENTTKLRHFPFMQESSFIAFSLSESIELSIFLHQLRMLCGKSLLSRLNRYRNRVISFILLFCIKLIFFYLNFQVIKIVIHINNANMVIIHPFQNFSLHVFLLMFLDIVHNRCHQACMLYSQYFHQKQRKRSPLKYCHHCF